MTLTPQQRGTLAEAAKHSWVSANTFAGALKSWPHYGRPRITVNSASACLRRLAARGLVERDELNPAIFRITDEGRKAIA